jgi:hypothetical protein
VATSLKVYAVAPVKPQAGLITGTSGLQVYPNPVLNELKFQSELDLSGALIKVYDFSGREVLQAKNVNNRLNVSRLTSGVYLITVNKNGQMITGRFIK